MTPQGMETEMTSLRDQMTLSRLDTPEKMAQEIASDEAFIARCAAAELSEPEPGKLQYGHMYGRYGVEIDSLETMTLWAQITDNLDWSKQWIIPAGKDRFDAAEPAMAYARKVLENKLRDIIAEAIKSTRAHADYIRSLQS